MKINSDGCALCDSTWGDYWRVIENKNLFFCCNICADLFESLINQIKLKLESDFVDEIQLKGNSKHRKIYVKVSSSHYSGDVSFRFGKIVELNLTKTKI